LAESKPLYPHALQMVGPKDASGGSAAPPDDWRSDHYLSRYRAERARRNIITATPLQAATAARATLVTSTMGRIFTPSGPITMAATGRPMDPPLPPPPAPPPILAERSPSCAAARFPKPAGKEPSPSPNPPPAPTSLAVITVYSPDTTGAANTAPGRAAACKLSINFSF